MENVYNELRVSGIQNTLRGATLHGDPEHYAIYVRVHNKEYKMKYRVHRFDLKMTTGQGNLEQFLNSLHGDVAAIIPNITISFFWVHRVDFVLIVEKI